ncbi:MAG: 1,4-dihydroxy-2-naphthoate polyprenyltransferase [Candidatus Hydrogenedentes bacterium]|nr:1,4-dihydroxy-2-naphthoate polyprenyltransferase [Candidatus Hydrogenedentota bacterium]
MTPVVPELHVPGNVPRGAWVWIFAARPRTLFAAAGPVIMGLAMAGTDGFFHALSAMATLACALLLQIGANYVNDYSDGTRGSDTADRLGPPRAVQSGWVSPRKMRQAAGLVLGLAFLIGLYLVYRGGWTLLLLGILAILSAVWYTAGPFPLGYYGLAEPFVFVFFGPVAVAGTYCVQAGSWSPAALVAGCGPGLLSVALLTVNNIRDLPQDRVAGKRTLAVRLGETFAIRLFTGCVGAAMILPPWCSARLAGLSLAAATGLLGVVTILLMPPAVMLIRKVKRDSGRALNQSLARTGQLIFAYSLVFSVAWITWFRVFARS